MSAMQCLVASDTKFMQYMPAMYVEYVLLERRVWSFILFLPSVSGRVWLLQLTILRRKEWLDFFFLSHAAFLEVHDGLLEEFIHYSHATQSDRSNRRVGCAHIIPRNASPNLVI